jgi:hypothetical protein
LTCDDNRLAGQDIAAYLPLLAPRLAPGNRVAVAKIY